MPNEIIKKPQTETHADIIAWEAEEYTYHPKSAWWYVVFTIVCAGLILFAVYNKSILTIVLFGLIILLAFIFTHRKPEQIMCELTPGGVSIGNLSIPYKQIKKFWLIYEPSTRTLNLETTAYLNSHVVIQLGTQDPVQVKLFLKQYLTEDLEQDESLVDIIARHLRF